MILMKNIIREGNPLLREKSVEVSLPLSKEDEDILVSMIEYIDNSIDEEIATKYDLRPAVGIAAPQIGILKKMFVIYLTDEQGREHFYPLVNPKIISTSVAKCYLAGGEGCLSVEEMHQGYVKRYLRIKMKAYDHISKQEVLLSLRGYVAIVLQHEYDHLFGTLYYDHINKNNPTDTSDGAVEIA